MSVTLAQALRMVDLEAGRTYRCEVDGRTVEVRVLEASSDRNAAALCQDLAPDSLRESDVMLEAWTELPLPKPTMTVVSHLGALEPPEVPFIPNDDQQ